MWPCARAPADEGHTLGLERGPQEVRGVIVAEWGGEGRREPEARAGDGVDGAATGGADEIAGEPLLAGARQRLEPDEREIEEGRDGDCDVDGHSGEDSGPVPASGHSSQCRQEYSPRDVERRVS